MSKKLNQKEIEQLEKAFKCLDSCNQLLLYKDENDLKESFLIWKPSDIVFEMSDNLNNEELSSLYFGYLIDDDTQEKVFTFAEYRIAVIDGLGCCYLQDGKSRKWLFENNHILKGELPRLIAKFFKQPLRRYYGEKGLHAFLHL